MKESKQNNLIELNFKCSKSWSDMTPTDNGKHCHDCNKTVRDFSKLHANEYTKQLESNVNETSCGNFYSHQKRHR